MSSPKTFFLLTQGCKVNQYESQLIRESWIQKGYREIKNTEQADILLINSCAVTQRAIQDLHNFIRRFQRPNAEIIVTGCAAQVFSKELKQLSGVTNVIPQFQKTKLWQNSEQKEKITGYYRARAAIKIHDGCTHNCTYCIIPQTRGRSRSRDFASITDEIRNLFQNGIKEISLCGVNLRLFGQDLLPTCDFWDLLTYLENNLAEFAPNHRLRLSSLEPSELGEKALGVLQKSKLICPHLHISLQSASDSVLRNMRRNHYKANDLLPFLQELRKFWPIFALGFDIITGFPGETDDFFIETLDFCRKSPLTYAHIFPYSPRPKTPAAHFPDQIFPHIRHKRAKELRYLVAQKKQDFLTTLSKQDRLKIVAENSQKGMCEFYVECRSQTRLISGELQTVRPLGVHNNTLLVSR